MKLLDVVRHPGGVIEKTWLHTDGAGKDNFTVETIQDVEPVFNRVRQLAETQRSKDMQYVGSISTVVITETAKTVAAYWGTSVREAFSELMQGQTDRAEKIWKMLLRHSDYSKFQARTWQR